MAVARDHSDRSAERIVNYPGMPDDVNRALERLEVRVLAPVLTVVTVRHKGEAAGPQGFLVEVALDEVTFIGPRGEAQEYGLELELRAGDVDRLKRIGDWLIARYGLLPSRPEFSVGIEKVG